MALGIENLKKVVKFGATLGEDVATVLEDGKITVVEALSLLPDLVGISGILESKEAIKAEFEDLTSEEMQELNDFVAAEFDITDDSLELKVEKAIAAALAILDLVGAFKKPA